MALPRPTGLRNDVRLADLPRLRVLPGATVVVVVVAGAAVVVVAATVVVVVDAVVVVVVSAVSGTVLTRKVGAE